MCEVPITITQASLGADLANSYGRWKYRKLYNYQKEPKQVQNLQLEIEDFQSLNGLLLEVDFIFTVVSSDAKTS